MTRLQGGMMAGAAVLVAAGVFLAREVASKPAVEASKNRPLDHRGSGHPPAAKTSQAIRRAPADPLKGLPALPPPEISPHSPGSPTEQEWVAGRIDALNDLAWSDDFAALAQILTELRNPLPEIRAAALTATKASGSRDAVPYLEKIAADTRDPTEQKSITGVIEHLNLPSVVEELQNQH